MISRVPEINLLLHLWLKTTALQSGLKMTDVPKQGKSEGVKSTQA